MHETMIWPTIVSRFDISLQNFKKPLDIFWPQLNTKKKRSEDWFIYGFGCKNKGKSERFSCLEFILKNSKHREAGLKHKSARFFIKFISLCLPDSWFSETLYPQFLSSWMKIVVSVHISPNSIYFIDCRLVASLAILIAAPLVFSHT